MNSKRTSVGILLSNRRKNDCDVESWGDWLKRDEEGKERSWCLGLEGDDSRGPRIHALGSCVFLV